jgi:hypothetical protein
MKNTKTIMRCEECDVYLRPENAMDRREDIQLFVCLLCNRRWYGSMNLTRLVIAA